jgi:hypothetical protein
MTARSVPRPRRAAGCSRRARDPASMHLTVGDARRFIQVAGSTLASLRFSSNVSRALTAGHLRSLSFVGFSAAPIGV